MVFLKRKLLKKHKDRTLNNIPAVLPVSNEKDED